MSLFDNADNILLLKKLLQNQDKADSSSDSEDDNRNEGGKLGPSHIGSKPQKSADTGPKENKPKDDTTIDKWLEAQEKEDADVLETRKRPEYTIRYKQAVGTEDLFLQMGNKSSASSSCEDMVIEIKMPEETVEVHQMDISVTENQIDLSTPVYRLKLPLMQPINPDRSSAKYYTESKTMSIVCRMNREYDFINF